MFLLQIDSTATAISTTNTINYFDLLLKGGFVVYIILGLLFVTLYFIFERWLYISSATKIDLGFLRTLKDSIMRGDLKTATMFCKSTNSPIARIVEKGITRIGRPVKDIESAMEIQGNLEISRMERNMGYLGLIAGIAPIMGFIGTISGVIRIFYSIAQANGLEINTISEGLYEKMISSFAGLVVGVIAYTGYHGLNMLIDKFAIHLQSTVMDFLDTINEPVR